MDMIDRIKRDVDMLGHDAHCVVGMRSYDGTLILKCDCGYASKLAFLDRLREPTRKMLYAGFETGAGPGLEVGFKAMLAAAQEGL